MTNNTRISVNVIGAGLAGLSAAKELAERGVYVRLFSVQASERAQSNLAEGGINACLDVMGENDTWIEHYEDTMKGGCYLADPDMSLDVGSIGKGYAVQRVMEYARAQGMDNILLSLGGNISGLGTRIDGTNFRIAIQNPDLDSDEEYIEKVDITDGQCVVSSGDYQRYYVVDGEVYCHIINPDTLYPARTFAAVSILTDDSGMADALSTAIYNMTLEEGMEFVDNLDNVEAMWVYHDGTKVYSKHFEESIAK